tara:strand:+ start:465 stop:623 length:159 start_codon:yes stop_codon:yes gene_type:complete
MNILDKIVNAKKLRLDELKNNFSLDEIKQKATNLENKLLHSEIHYCHQINRS